MRLKASGDAMVIARIARILRDICLIGVGIIAVVTVPPSLREFGIVSVLGMMWAAMIGGGALASLYGVLWRKVTAEIYGCTFVGGGFAVWAIAAVARPDADLTSMQIALVFLSGTAGQLYRVGMISEGRVRG